MFNGTSKNLSGILIFHLWILKISMLYIKASIRFMFITTQDYQPSSLRSNKTYEKKMLVIRNCLPPRYGHTKDNGRRNKSHDRQKPLSWFSTIGSLPTWTFGRAPAVSDRHRRCPQPIANVIGTTRILSTSEVIEIITNERLVGKANCTIILDQRVIDSKCAALCHVLTSVTVCLGQAWRNAWKIWGSNR